jgi:uncharacterized cofD-like protein
MLVEKKKRNNTFLAWFFPGLRLKRWIFLGVLGLALCIFSAVRYQAHAPAGRTGYMYFLGILLGCLLLIEGIRFFILSMVDVYAPDKKKHQLLDLVYNRRLLERGPKIVAIGGGTGLSTLLSGLKHYSTNLTAIVTVADDGGSSGRLRKEFDILPPGDIRNCLAALADESDLMRKLFQYRFDKGEGVAGHSFGNLFITAMREVTGRFDTAIEESSKILAIRGRVLPASLDNLKLMAEYDDGSKVIGEDAIPKKGVPIKRLGLMPDDAKASLEAISAILDADLIVLGPGSLYTSILPNLLIRDICQAVLDSSACKMYVCNIMTQHGETDGYTAARHLKVLIDHAGEQICHYCIVNYAACDTSTLLKYARQNSFPVIPDKERIEWLGCQAIVSDLISESEYIRHDPEKLMKTIIDAYNGWKKARPLY